MHHRTPEVRNRHMIIFQEARSHVSTYQQSHRNQITCLCSRVCIENWCLTLPNHTQPLKHYNRCTIITHVTSLQLGDLLHMPRVFFFRSTLCWHKDLWWKLSGQAKKCQVSRIWRLLGSVFCMLGSTISIPRATPQQTWLTKAGRQHNEGLSNLEQQLHHSHKLQSCVNVVDSSS